MKTRKESQTRMACITLYKNSCNKVLQPGRKRLTKYPVKNSVNDKQQHRVVTTMSTEMVKYGKVI